MSIAEILAFIRSLPRRERLRVVERIVHEAAEADTVEPPAAPPAIWRDATDEEFGDFLAAVQSARSSEALRAGDGSRGR